MNHLLLTDSYKITHWRQYPPGTEVVHSYFESRGGQYDHVVFFGLQPALDHLSWGFIKGNIDEATDLLSVHLGPGMFNREGFLTMLRATGGQWPVRVWAVPEGSVTAPHTVLLSIENTDPRFPWVTNYLETLLSQVWYPCTVATRSRACRAVIQKYLTLTGSDSPDFKLHDFGVRGSTSMESAAIGGAAHLVNFKGTDNLPALTLLRRHYQEACGGYSIPASEHSTMTTWGRKGEADAVFNMLKTFPKGAVAIVGDSYDIFQFANILLGGEFHFNIVRRDGVVILRPDSGDPREVILRLLQILGNKIGMKTNEKGFNVLDPHIRLIQGDGVSPSMIETILLTLHAHGWSADNLAFGMGHELLQAVGRDTCKFAFKCSAVRIKGEWRDVWKDPVTDRGKASKRGRFVEDPLQLVFDQGKVVKRYTFEDIRQRAALGGQDVVSTQVP